MDREDVIRLAREAGLHHFYDSEGHCSGVTNAKIEGEENNDALVAMLAPFAALVAAAEREACAKLCEEMARRHDDIRRAALEVAAEWIRARGNK